MPSGRTIGSPSAMTALANFANSSGRSGPSRPPSATCSRVVQPDADDLAGHGNGAGPAADRDRPRAVRAAWPVSGLPAVVDGHPSQVRAGTSSPRRSRARPVSSRPSTVDAVASSPDRSRSARSTPRRPSWRSGDGSVEADALGAALGGAGLGDGAGTDGSGGATNALVGVEPLGVGRRRTRARLGSSSSSSGSTRPQTRAAYGVAIVVEAGEDRPDARAGLKPQTGLGGKRSKNARSCRLARPRSRRRCRRGTGRRGRRAPGCGSSPAG